MSVKTQRPPTRDAAGDGSSADTWLPASHTASQMTAKGATREFCPTARVVAIHA